MKHGSSSIALFVIAFLSVSAAPIEEILPAFEKEPLERVPLLVRDDDLSIRDDTEVTETGSWEYGAPEETIEAPAENTELQAIAGEPSQFDERAVLPHECAPVAVPVPVAVPHHDDDDDATKAVPKVVERMPLIKMD
ncbi:hypothetical protein SLS63_006659 [Diaporthe eres]|uniref:Secreted protein n=1 Tax=Diaporthe eres TaxID=83184 RepID=A0ABR1P7Q1_DIAER